MLNCMYAIAAIMGFLFVVEYMEWFAYIYMMGSIALGVELYDLQQKIKEYKNQVKKG